MTTSTINTMSKQYFQGGRRILLIHVLIRVSFETRRLLGLHGKFHCRLLSFQVISVVSLRPPPTKFTVQVIESSLLASLVECTCNNIRFLAPFTVCSYQNY
jgi:hypothetical protein